MTPYEIAVERYGKRIVDNLIPSDITKDKHCILMMSNLFSEDMDYDVINDIMSKYFQIEQYLDLSEQNNYDKYSGDIDIDISVGTFRMSNNPPILKKCQIYYDDGISIYKPKSFEEASAIGGNIWNFCGDNTVFQKYADAKCNFYFIHNVWSNAATDFAAVIVKPKGFISVYKKDGGIMSKQEYAIWREELGNDAFYYLKPPTNENKEIKNNRHMNKKLIRLTESDLHRIVRESVSSILKEDYYSNSTTTQQGQNQQQGQQQQVQMTQFQQSLVRFLNQFSQGMSQQMQNNQSQIMQALSEIQNQIRNQNRGGY